jgi:hypothetical protein
MHNIVTVKWFFSAIGTIAIIFLSFVPIIFVLFCLPETRCKINNCLNAQTEAGLDWRQLLVDFTVVLLILYIEQL